MPSSWFTLRTTASSIASPGDGWPQHVLVHTPGKVALDSARRVTSSRPDSSST
jgi:hypothetical protein